MLTYRCGFLGALGLGLPLGEGSLSKSKPAGLSDLTFDYFKIDFCLTRGGVYDWGTINSSD